MSLPCSEQLVPAQGRRVQSELSEGTAFSQLASPGVPSASCVPCCRHNQPKLFSKESSNIQFALLKQTCSQELTRCCSWFRATG